MSQNPPEHPDSTPEGAATSADPPAYPSSTGSASLTGSGEAPGSGAPSSYPSGSDPSQAYGYSQPSANQPYVQPSANQPYGQPSANQPYGQPGYPDPNAAYPQQGYDPNATYGQAQQPGSYPPYSDPNQPQGYPPQPYQQPGYPQQAYSGAPGQAPASESDEKTWGIISHISIPFFGFIGPLIGYLLYKDRSEYLKQVTTEALNFSILYSIAYVISVITVSVFIGAILWPLVFIAGLIFCIMGTMAASRHEFYKYPVNIRFIK